MERCDIIASCNQIRIYTLHILPKLKLLIVVCHSAAVMYYRFLPGARFGGGSWFPPLLVTFAFAVGFGGARLVAIMAQCVSGG